MAGSFTCKGGELWKEGGKYAVRFSIAGEGKTVEIHGLDRVVIQDPQDYEYAGEVN